MQFLPCGELVIHHLKPSTRVIPVNALTKGLPVNKVPGIRVPVESGRQILTIFRYGVGTAYFLLQFGRYH